MAKKDALISQTEQQVGFSLAPLSAGKLGGGVCVCV